MPRHQNHYSTHCCHPTRINLDRSECLHNRSSLKLCLINCTSNTNLFISNLYVARVGHQRTQAHLGTMAPQQHTKAVVSSTNSCLSVGTLVQRACFHPMPLLTTQSACVIRHPRGIWQDMAVHRARGRWCWHKHIFSEPKHRPMLLKNTMMMQLRPFCTSFFRSFSFGLYNPKCLIDLFGLFS